MNASQQQQQQQQLPAIHLADVTCPICLSPLTDPFVTSCGHTFCYSCITQHTQHNKNCPCCFKFVSQEHIFPNFLLSKLAVKIANHAAQQLSPLGQLQAAVLDDSFTCSPSELGDVIEKLQEKKAILEEQETENNLDLLLQFLHYSRQQKAARLEELRAELVSLDTDIRAVQHRQVPALAASALAASPSSAAWQVEGYGGTGNMPLEVPATADYRLRTNFALEAAANQQLPGIVANGGMTMDTALSRHAQAGSSGTLDPTVHPQPAGVLAAAQEGAEDRTVKRQRIASQFDDLHEYYVKLRMQRALQQASADGRPASALALHHGLPLNKAAAPAAAGSSASTGMQQQQQEPGSAIAVADGVPTREQAVGVPEDTGLLEFSRMLSVFANCGRLEVVGSIRSNAANQQHAILSAVDFDRDGEAFATGGVGKRISVYSMRTVLSNSQTDEHLPVTDISTRSKLTSLSWNPYIKAQLISSDYEGVVSLWDVSQSKTVVEYEAHDSRIWSVDFCKVDPVVFASGGNDGWVKVWTTKQPNSVADIDVKANVCCVEYNPRLAYQLAVGSADHLVHVYDLRQLSQPLYRFAGHQRAVSYVRYMSEKELASASTDASLRLWAPTTNAAVNPVRKFSGHANERSFVGMAASEEFLACGSETNEVYVYFKALSAPIAKASFGDGDDMASGHDGAQFISAVCWQPNSRMLVAANSQGCIKVMKLSATSS